MQDKLLESVGLGGWRRLLRKRWARCGAFWRRSVLSSTRSFAAFCRLQVICINTLCVGTSVLCAMLELQPALDTCSMNFKICRWLQRCMLSLCIRAAAGAKQL